MVVPVGGGGQNGPMLIVDVAATSDAVAATSGRRAKVDLLAACLRAAAPDEVAIVTAWLSGQPRQRRTGLGWASLQNVPPPATVARLSVVEVDAAFEAAQQAGGAGSQVVRRDVLLGLLASATEPEQRLIAGLVAGELRHGAQAGLVLDAVATAAVVPVEAVRRAVTLTGDLPAVAVRALAQGEAGLRAFGLRVGRPLSPMLAQSAPDLAEALQRTGAAGVEWKLDGVRVQVHRDGMDVAVFTRTLDDVTARHPEVVEATLALPVRSSVLDGEVIALRPDGRPRPFQVTASRAARQGGPAAAGTPLTTVLLRRPPRRRGRPRRP